ncbi:hypothetical protein PAMC26510_12880 [Caballeronia sordidicola]|uniref:Uncharacterized protein n=1 Tax=Caballeronia sordidicola TaxID=196367 RepID=A0A242MYA7_CABSO|nr:hypothetical protein PAMC26510_12880 [Caballeronia sordidicola]
MPARILLWASESRRRRGNLEQYIACHPIKQQRVIFARPPARKNAFSSVSDYD